MNPRVATLVVEFFGPAGVGKTSLAGQLERLLVARGVPCLRRDEPWQPGQPVRRLARKAKLVTRAPLVCPSEARDAFRAVRASHQRRARDVVSVLGNWWYLVALEAESRRPGRAVLFDQGIFQAAASVVMSAKSGDSTALETALQRACEQPRLVVRVSAPEGLVRRRVRSRRVPPSVMGRGREALQLASSASACARINAMLERLAGVQPRLSVHHLDNSCEGFDAPALERLVQHVQTMMASEPA